MTHLKPIPIEAIRRLAMNDIQAGLHEDADEGIGSDAVKVIPPMDVINRILGEMPD